MLLSLAISHPPSFSPSLSLLLYIPPSLSPSFSLSLLSISRLLSLFFPPSLPFLFPLCNSSHFSLFPLSIMVTFLLIFSLDFYFETFALLLYSLAFIVSLSETLLFNLLYFRFSSPFLFNSFSLILFYLFLSKIRPSYDNREFSQYSIFFSQKRLFHFAVDNTKTKL